MKRMKIWTIAMLGMAGLMTTTANAQQNKAPIRVYDAPTLSNASANLYYDYADQGQRMYQNNSHFQNKDNVMTHRFPASNGQYVTPGNSNPINQNMNDGSLIPSGTIYSGYIPIRDYGNSSSGQSGYIR
jgi:hypothetical protein